MAARRNVESWLIVLFTITVATTAVLVPLSVTVRPSVAVSGLRDGAVVTPSALRSVFVLTQGDPDAIEVLLDGAPGPVRRDGRRLRLAVDEPTEGEHTLSVRHSHSVPLLPESETMLRYTVDGTAPDLAVDPIEPIARGDRAVVRGTARGANSVRAGSKTVAVGPKGRFTLRLPKGARTVTVTARDAAGNTSTRRVDVPVRHPGTRAVHLSASAWSSPTLREPVLRLARQGRIDTVQLDIKDESGEIGYRSQVPLARRIGATRAYYDARKALDTLHRAGLRVVGRVVAFRDPILAKASWRSGHRERVVQTTAGTPWTGGYGEYAFTNFADPVVRDYNIAIAEEAARLGFDDILYDYIRRPDGDISRMRIPRLRDTPEAAIADFLARSAPAVHRHGALLGASVFGIAASRPEQIAQDIPAMSQPADYIAPMVYPSHWGPGEYGVADPESQPYDITARSLAHFAKLTEGRADVVPWLQAFSLREHYGPEKVRAQIRAAADNGIDSFLLWNARCRYDPAALSRGR